mgnify:CR=1 FL=1
MKSCNNFVLMDNIKKSIRISSIILLWDLVLIIYIYIHDWKFPFQSYDRNWKSKNNLSINKLLDYWFFIHNWPYWHDHHARDFSTEVLNESSPNLDCDLIITLLNNELPLQWRVQWFDIKWYTDAHEKDKITNAILRTMPWIILWTC